MFTLNPEKIRQANDNSLTGRAGDNIAADMEKAFARYAAQLPPRAELEEDQQAYYDQRAEGWNALVFEAYNDQLSRRAAFVPWYIAGPSKYPVSKAQKQIDAQRAAEEKYAEKMSAYLEHTLKGIARRESSARQIARYQQGSAEPVQMGDPLALEKLHARADYLTAQHAQAKRENAFYRKSGTLEGCAGVTPERAAALASIIAQCGTPHPPFDLSSILDSLHRTQARIRQLEAMKAASCHQPEEPEADAPYQVVENGEAARLQLIFDDIPPEAVRALLKSNGFRWSPKNHAWQRQLTPNALHALARIRAQLDALLEGGSAQ